MPGRQAGIWRDVQGALGGRRVEPAPLPLGSCWAGGSGGGVGARPSPSSVQGATPRVGTWGISQGDRVPALALRVHRLGWGLQEGLHWPREQVLCPSPCTPPPWAHTPKSDKQPQEGLGELGSILDRRRGSLHRKPLSRLTRCPVVSLRLKMWAGEVSGCWGGASWRLGQGGPAAAREGASTRVRGHPVSPCQDARR